MSTSQLLLLILLVLPLTGAIIVALLGAQRRPLVRWVSLGVSCLCVALSVLLALNFYGIQQSSRYKDEHKQITDGKAIPSFLPEMVPGSSSQQHTTTWNLLDLNPNPDAPASSSGGVQFYLGIDGLNIWLIVLTALLMIPTVLISWEHIEDRANEFYAWLLFLKTTMFGIFMAFDVVLFYVFFELSLVPLFFLIGIWGGPQRQYAARKFLIYTLAGSLITLLGIIGIILSCYSYDMAKADEVVKKAQVKVVGLERKYGANPQAPNEVAELQQARTQRDAARQRMNNVHATFSIPELVRKVHVASSDSEQISDGRGGKKHVSSLYWKDDGWWTNRQAWLFLALMVGLSIKVPLVPVHTWLPLAHVEAPTAGSVDLAGVLLKVGAFGFLRLCIPLAPDASYHVGLPLLSTLAVIGIIYGAFCAYAQTDMKKLIAYSSVSHLGMCMLGIFALNQVGITGGIMVMINHGLSTAGLFLVIGMIYERYHTREMGLYGGMSTRLPLIGAFLVYICLTSVGLPGLNGFIGELLVLMGVMNSEIDPARSVKGFPYYAVFASLGIVLGAWYLFTMLRKVLFGPMKEPEVHHAEGEEPVPIVDMKPREWALITPIAILCLVIGLYPQPLIKVVEPDVSLISTMTDQARTGEKFVPEENRNEVALDDN